MNKSETPSEGDSLSADDIEINLRPAADVARRLIIRAAICARVYLELGRTPRLDLPNAETERFDLYAWLENEGLTSDLTPEESSLLTSRIRGFSRERASEESWSVESVAALGWALKLLKKPLPYDRQADIASLLHHLPEPADNTKPFIARARLRPLPEIAAERERAELWYWRGAIASEIHLGEAEMSPELTTLISLVASEAANTGLIPRTIDEDFPVRRQAYAALPLEDQVQVFVIAMYRLHALNWVCGYGASWDDVPLDIEPDSSDS